MWKKLKFNSYSPAVRGEGMTPPEQWQRFVEGFDFFALIAAWKDIVGTTYAEQSLPLRLKNRTLFILTRYPAIASNMKYDEKTILKKIASRFPEAAPMLESIAFETNESFFLDRAKVHHKPTPPRLHPFSPEYRKAKAEADKIFGDVADPTEKERWISLYIQSYLPTPHE